MARRGFMKISRKIKNSFKKHLHVCILLAVIALTFIAYYPSLFHVARADHLFYLADMAHKEGWADLTFGSFDFSRSRIFAPGDGFSFRPGSMALLGTEKYLFGLNFFWWQLTGILLHCGIVISLYRLLMNIHKGLFAVFLTAFFALLFINIETVTWHHIHGLLLFIFLLLISLNQLYMYDKNNSTSEWRLGITIFCMTIACLTYEIGNIFCVLLCVFAIISRKQNGKKLWPSLSLLLPIVVYTTLSTANYFAAYSPSSGSGKSLQWANSLTHLKNIVLTFSWWVYSGLFPSQIDIKHELGRAWITTPDRLFTALNIAQPIILIGIALIILYVLILAVTYEKSFFKDRLLFTLLIATMSSAWIGVIAVYRVFNRGPAFTLGGTLYYQYMFWLFLIILAYHLINFAKAQKTASLRLIKPAAALTLIAATLYNGSSVYALNRRLQQEYFPRRQLVLNIETMRKQVGDNEGFSFYVSPDFPGNFVYPNSITDIDPITKRYSFVEMVYLKYFKKEKPRYIFYVDKGGTPKVIRTKW